MKTLFLYSYHLPTFFNIPSGNVISFAFEQIRGLCYVAILHSITLDWLKLTMCQHDRVTVTAAYVLISGTKFNSNGYWSPMIRIDVTRNACHNRTKRHRTVKQPIDFYFVFGDSYDHKIIVKYWGRETHICDVNLTNIGSDNGLSAPSLYLNKCWNIVN